MKARFNHNDHSVIPGWATYHKHLAGWKRLLCAIRGHVVQLAVPSPANGYSPSNYARCGRCHAALKWFVVGQHRYGSLHASSDFWAIAR